jgi:hypothetical protein
LKEERKLRVFEKRVLRSKWDEGAGDWRALHDEFHDLDTSLNII